MVDLQSLFGVYLFLITNLHLKIRINANICCVSCVLRSNSTPNLSSSQTLESSELGNDSVR